jgi:hypothetical protein
MFDCVAPSRRCTDRREKRRDRSQQGVVLSIPSENRPLQSYQERPRRFFDARSVESCSLSSSRRSGSRS